MRLVRTAEADLRRAESERARTLRQQAWALRVGGASPTEIAEALHVSRATADNWIDAEGEAAAKEERKWQRVERARALSIARLEKNLIALNGIIGNPISKPIMVIEATKAAVKVEDHIAKLRGSYAPMKVASTNPTGDQWAPFRLKLKLMTNEQVETLHAIKRLMLDDAEVLDGETVEDKTGTDED